MLMVIVLLLAGIVRAEDDLVDKIAANPTSTGLLIAEVVEGSQAASVGLLPGDILTSYNGKAVVSMEDLGVAMGEVNLPDKVKIEVDRAGKTQELEIATGQMGILVSAVKKGEALRLPPATEVTFDFSRIEKGGDAWYSFADDGTHKSGYEHYTWKVEGGRATFDSEVAFDADGEGGLNHFVVEDLVALGKPPRGVSSHLESLLEKSTSNWEAPSKPPADGVIPQYFVYALARCMPQKKGACYHFIPEDESTGKTGRAAALLVVGQEATQVGDREVQTWRIEWRSLGQVESTLWADADGNLVRMDYGGAVATSATKEEALKDLNEKLQPHEK